jgi:hypothetical protein
MTNHPDPHRPRDVRRPVWPVADDETGVLFSERSERAPQLARGLVWSDLLAEIAAEEAVRRAA